MQRNELTIDQFRTLAEEAREFGVVFLCTCFDPQTVDDLDGVLPAFKVASGDLTNDQLLRAIAVTKKPVLLSTGMSTLDEIAHALTVLAEGGDLTTLQDRVVLVQCISSYPCPVEQVQLRAMDRLREAFGLRTGYSDHTLDLVACQVAVAMGACVVEKHFTDVKSGRTFRDHALSAEPHEFRDLVERVRLIEQLRGAHEKTVQPAESSNRLPMRRSVGVARDVAAGTVLTEELLIALRPASGWPMSDWAKLHGRMLVRPLKAGDLISPSDLAAQKD